MAKISIHVWHNLTGEIVAVGRPIGGAKCTPLSGENQAVLEAVIEEELLSSLHKTHKVDMTQKAVVKQSRE